MTNLILCGGAGTRLWPLSRNSRPKQFYPLFGGKSIFQETVERNRVVADRFWVAANRVQMELARDQLGACGNPPTQFLIEPSGRNTAPAIALACLGLPVDEVVFVTPSDHRMNRHEDYWRAVGRAKALAEQGYVVTFGITPTFPETGFGYIEADGENVKSFREKPDAATARDYVDSGRYLWNSGMFVFRAGTYLEELENHCREVLDASRRAFAAGKTSLGIEPTLSDMTAIPSISIDYAVMEKSSRVKVVACDPGWSDLGSFDALADEVPPSSLGNSILGPGNPILVDARNNLVVGGTRKIALVDVEGLMIIDTPDALLIVKRGSSQKVKDVVNELKHSDAHLLK
jgi:mannose-1-phosphate guanylyltransferase